MKNFKFKSDSTYRVIPASQFMYLAEVCKTGFVLFNVITFDGDEIILTPCTLQKNRSLYNSFGKIEGVKSRERQANNKSEVVTAILATREFVESIRIAEEKARETRKIELQKIKEIEKLERAEKYNTLVNSFDVIPTNVANLSIILNYFADFDNWNHPPFPNLACGYSMNWYDCDGRNGIAIKLDESIQTVDGFKSQFCVAPRRHLVNYYHL